MEVPAISYMQKLVLYETKARYYIVGSNNIETKFRVLKIDRMEPRELILNDDKVEYTKNEIRNLLTMIDSGNRAYTGPRIGSGLAKNISAFGIVGFVRFLEGYYIILITKRKRVALIGSNTIFKVEDTSMLYLPNDGVRYIHPDESRYVKMFQNIDLSSNFYFSYSYDLTHTLQYNMTSCKNLSDIPDISESRERKVSFWGTEEERMPLSPESQTELKPNKSVQSLQEMNVLNDTNRKGSSPVQESNEDDMVYAIRTKPTYKFIWNSHLLDKFADVVHPDWVLYITHGFIGQSNHFLDVCVYGKPIYVTLLARRSNRFAGTRFLKRGANSQGDVANEIETEQIVHDASQTFLDKGKLTSFVQVRGSIPLYWSQDIAKMVPKPPIVLDQMDPYAYAAGRHFNRVLKRYGAPVMILNLVKTREKKRHESILSEEFVPTISYLNQFLPDPYNLQYIGFDMARVNKRKDANVLVRLAKIAKYCVKQTGFFTHGLQNEGHGEHIWTNEQLKGVRGEKTMFGSKQTGVVRTNCVDCLDRTNTAQFAVGKCALGYQLFVLGVVASPMLEFDTDCVRMLEELYEDQGDTLALQYGGSQLVHRIKGYRKISPWTSHSRDIMQSLSRYYSNAFSDAEKQHAINLFLGKFKPTEGQLNLWELSTDFYLHNKEAAGLFPFTRKSYSQWWDLPVSKCLPLSYEEETKCAEDQQTVCKTSRYDEKVDNFWEYYRPYELTVMDELFSFTMTHSLRNFMPKSVTEYSPFALRIRPDRRHEESGLVTFSHKFNRTILSVNSSGRHDPNPNITGKESSSSTLSTGSDGSSSSSESSGVEGNIDISETSSSEESKEGHKMVSLKDLFPSVKSVYNVEISDPTRSDQRLYDRYVHIGECASETSTLSDVPRAAKKTTDLFPISAFKLDSCYGVEPPPVSRHSQEIYKAYCLRGKYGAGPPTDHDMNMYRQYVSHKYM